MKPPALETFYDVEHTRSTRFYCQECGQFSSSNGVLMNHHLEKGQKLNWGTVINKVFKIVIDDYMSRKS